MYAIRSYYDIWASCFAHFLLHTHVSAPLAFFSQGVYHQLLSIGRVDDKFFLSDTHRAQLIHVILRYNVMISLPLNTGFLIHHLMGDMRGVIVMPWQSYNFV